MCVAIYTYVYIYICTNIHIMQHNDSAINSAIAAWHGHTCVFIMLVKYYGKSG